MIGSIPPTDTLDLIVMSGRTRTTPRQGHVLASLIWRRHRDRQDGSDANDDDAAEVLERARAATWRGHLLEESRFLVLEDGDRHDCDRFACEFCYVRVIVL